MKLSRRAFLISSVAAATVATLPVIVLAPKLELRDKIWVSVKDYGAVGDGVVDDTLAIQRAIREIFIHGGTNGGTVYFPPGYYHITRPIQLRGDTALLSKKMPEEE